MLKHLATAALISIALSAIAQEPAGSIKTQELDEVVVEARNQRINVDVSTYIPASNQKNAAQNAVSLLVHMAIPQIKVDPVNLAVKNAQGHDVALFIDFLPATKEDFYR